MLHWKVETMCVDNKKVVFEVDKAGIFKVIEQERDVLIRELNEMHEMVKMMDNSKYIKMECTKLP